MELELMIIAFIAVNLLAIKFKVPLLNICVSIVSFFLVFTGAEVAFYPVPNMLLGLIAVVSLVQAFKEM